MARRRTPDRSSTGQQNGVAPMRIVVPDKSDIGRLNALGVDLAEYVSARTGGNRVQSRSTTASRCMRSSARLKARRCVTRASTCRTPSPTRATTRRTWPSGPPAIRAATAATASTDTLTVLRAEWFSSLSRMQENRGTAIWPGRTGPVTDVLYSAAGNSADEHWYSRGIIGWDLEVGADIYNPATGWFSAVGFQPPFAERHEEAMEFANGNIAILEVAGRTRPTRSSPRPH